MPTLDPRIIQGLGEIGGVIVKRDLPTHEIVEAFIVGKIPYYPNRSSFLNFCTYYEAVFISIFGVGGAIVYAIKKC